MAAAALCGGCRAAYLARVAVEEVRWLGAAKPATEVLATTGDPERRRALATLLEVRAFAASEGLDVGGSYRKVVDVSSASPFHVVTAAWTDRLEPYTWWYPVIGSIPYRGYFDHESAERFAAGLRRQGLDTRVVEASAYSTLGWFDDPLPSSVLDAGEAAVVVTVLHELVHQTFFAPGQVAFNETLATAVSWRLAEKFYVSRGDAAGAARMRMGRIRWLARSDVLDRAAARLGAFFARARAEGMDHARMMEERAVLYTAILDDVAQADPAFADQLRKGGLDNASFLAEHRYADGGRAIDAFLGAQAGMKAALDVLAAAAREKRDLAAVVALPAAAAAGS